MLDRPVVNLARERLLDALSDVFTCSRAVLAEWVEVCFMLHVVLRTYVSVAAVGADLNAASIDAVCLVKSIESIAAGLGLIEVEVR